MKVLVISSKFHPEFSGSGFRAKSTYKRLGKKYGIKYDIICNSVEYHGNKKYRYDRINVFRISSLLFEYLPESQGKKISCLNLVAKYFHESISTVKLLLKERYDLIHSFGNSSSVATATILSGILKKPMIIELCNRLDDPHPYFPILSRIKKPDCNKGKVFVAISNELKNICKNFGYVDNVWCRPNPIDSQRFTVGRREDGVFYRENLTPFTRQDVVLTYIAKFWPQKNHIFLLDVLKILPPHYKLIIAGPAVSRGKNLKRDRNYLKKIRERIGDLQIVERVLLVVGEVRVEEYLSMTDIYLIPARNEALGTSMIESMACGIPVVANAGEEAFRQWINDGENGYLCKLDNAEWSHAIKKARLFDNKKQEKISAAIHSKASSDLIDASYMKIFRALIDAGYSRTVKINALLAPENMGN